MRKTEIMDVGKMMIEIFQRRTSCVQLVLEKVINETMKNCPYENEIDKDICIMSFGSLSRNEMFYHTDLDTLVVCATTENEEYTKKVIRKFKEISEERFCGDSDNKEESVPHFKYIEVCPFWTFSVVEKYALRCCCFRNSFRDSQFLFCGSEKIRKLILGLKKRVETVQSMEYNISFNFNYFCFQKNTYKTDTIKRKGTRMLLFLNWFQKLIKYRGNMENFPKREEQKLPCYVVGLELYRKLVDSNFDKEEYVHLLCYFRCLFLRNTRGTKKLEDIEEIYGIIFEESKKEKGMLERYSIQDVSDIRRLLNRCFKILEDMGSKIQKYVIETAKNRKYIEEIVKLWNDPIETCNNLEFVLEYCKWKKENPPRMEILMTISIFTSKLEVLETILPVVSRTGYNFACFELAKNAAATDTFLRSIVNSKTILNAFKYTAMRILKLN